MKILVVVFIFFGPCQLGAQTFVVFIEKIDDTDNIIVSIDPFSWCYLTPAWYTFGFYPTALWFQAISHFNNYERTLANTRCLVVKCGIKLQEYKEYVKKLIFNVF